MLAPQLTPEFAATVPLSLRPFKRAGEVDAILSDPAYIGDDVIVRICPPSREVPEGKFAIDVFFPPSLLPSRRTLYLVAGGVQKLYEQRSQIEGE